MRKHTVHKHHIIPKHVGGTDDPSNLVELTVEEHADAHKKLYEQYGRWQDKVAWMGLSKLISSAEAYYEAMRESKKGENNPMYGKAAPNRGVKRPGIGGRKKGTVWSKEEREAQEKIRSAAGYYDYLKDPKRGEKISASQIGREGAAKNKKWYNDGIKEKYSDTPIDGWNEGRLAGREVNKKGLLWYNNSEVNKQFRLGQEPEGFVRGRISKK